MWNWLSCLVVLVVSVAAGCDYMDTFEKQYSSYGDLASDNEPGNWVPIFVPRTARDMKLSAKVDTGEELFAFTITEEFSAAACRIVSKDKDRLPSESFLLARPWWPKDLTRQGTDSQGGYIYYTCEGGYSMAIKSGDGAAHGFLWHILPGR